ncbi:MAG: hypothetical protein AB8B61_10250 [Cyclobacteriaceae bacterium]
MKVLELKKVLSGKYANKILNSTTFPTAKIGQFGEIYWSDIAEMKDENGNTISCAYDLSPEFAYHNSVSL